MCVLGSASVLNQCCKDVKYGKMYSRAKIDLRHLLNVRARIQAFASIYIYPQCELLYYYYYYYYDLNPGCDEADNGKRGDVDDILAVVCVLGNGDRTMRQEHMRILI